VDYVLGILLAIFLAIYIAAPLAVKFTNWQSARPRVEPLGEHDTFRLASNVTAFLESTSESLRQIGFDEVARLVLVGQANDMKTYLHVLRKSPEQDWAMVAVMIVEMNNVRREHKYTEFSTSFDDETEVGTNNSSELPGYECGPWKTLIQLPSCRDISFLYRVHRVALAKYGGLSRPRVIPDSLIASFLSEEILRELHEQEERGYFFLDAMEGKYRPTFKGAFLMTWKLMWPLKPIREVLHSWRARKLLAELGV